MKKKIRKFLKTFLPVGIGLFFVLHTYNQFTENQINEIVHQLNGINYWMIVLSLFLGFLSHLSRSYRWNFLLEPLGYKIRFGNSVMAVFVAYFMNLFVPRSGEVSRALIAQKYEKIPFNKAIGTIITERLVDLLILALCVLWALIIQFDIIDEFILQKIDFKKLILIGLFAIILLGSFLLYLYKSKKGFALHIKKFLSGIKEGGTTLFYLKKPKAFIFHTLFIWFMYLSMFYVAALSIDSTASIGFGTTLTTFIVGGIAIAFTNGGFGSYPYLVAEMLLLYNIPETSGTAFGWAIWTSQFVMFILLGSLSLILLPVLNKEKKASSF